MGSRPPYKAPETMESKIKERWTRLTDQDIEDLNGHLDRLAEKIQRAYGEPKEKAEREVREFRKFFTQISII